MAPPKFADLSKQFKDLSTDDFGFGVAKLTVKGKSSNGVTFKAEETRKLADGSLSSLFEAKFTCPITGSAVKTTIDSSNVIGTDIGYSNKSLVGHKFTFNKSCNKGANWSADLKLKHEYSNEKVFVESTYNVATLNTNAVFSVGDFNLGFSATLDASKGALKTHTAAVNFKHNASTINVGVTDASDIALNLFTTEGSRQFGTGVSYNLKSGESKIGAVAKFGTDDLFTKVSIDKSLTLGVATTTKVRQGLSLTLGSSLDLSNISTDKLTLGAALTLDA